MKTREEINEIRKKLAKLANEHRCNDPGCDFVYGIECYSAALRWVLGECEEYAQHVQHLITQIENEQIINPRD
jgi:hypothetical protein